MHLFDIEKNKLFLFAEIFGILDPMVMSGLDDFDEFGFDEGEFVKSEGAFVKLVIGDLVGGYPIDHGTDGIFGVIVKCSGGGFEGMASIIIAASLLCGLGPGYRKVFSSMSAVLPSILATCIA